MSLPVLIVAGLDSSGGAGLARDLATAAAMGRAARLAATAVTAQGAAGVTAIAPVPPATVAAQIRAAGPVGAVKIGMLGDAATVAAVAEALPDGVPVVLDPVLCASSGAMLLDPPGVAAMVARLWPRADLLTPNLPEAARLTGLPDDDPDALAAALRGLGARAVLLKGGHAAGAEAVDRLYRASPAPLPFAAPRLPGTRRGTGCTLATAIACALAGGADLAAACAAGRAVVQRYLASGA